MEESKILDSNYTEDSEITIDFLSNLERKVTIKVPAFEVDKKFQEFFNNIKRDVDLPGFRRGKAPISALRQRFEEKARNTVAQTLINEQYMKAVTKFDFIPIGQPRADKSTTQEYFGSFNEDNTYTVSLTLEVMPKLDPQGYIGLNIKLPSFDKDGAAKNKLEQYSKNFATHEQVTDVPAVLGDTLVIDFVGYIDGEKFEGGSAEGHSINNLGNSNFIPGFEDQLIGIKTGDVKDILITFPTDYRATHLAGKEAKFTIIVHSVVKNIPAELNDDLALMTGCENISKLMEKVAEEVEAEYEKAKSALAEHQIVKELVLANNFEIPQSLMSKELDRLVNQIGYENLTNDIVEGLKENATNNVKAAFIVNSIYDKEKQLEISKDEFESLVSNYATSMNKTSSEVIDMLYKANQLEAFVSALKKNKVVNYILKNANVTIN